MKNNSRFTKIAVATGLVVTSGAAVLGLTGFASAQQAHRNNVAAVAVAADNSNDSGAATATDGAANGSVGTQSVDGAPVAPFAQDANRPNPVATAAKALGMTEAELTTELKAGKSISDVAKAKNVDLADVKAALIAEMKDHFAAEVKTGEHTQAEADAKIAEMTANLDKMLTTAGLPQGPGGHGGPGGQMGGKGGHGPSAAEKAALAKVLNLTEAELQTQSQTKSLADIAKAQNVDIADVKAVIVSGFKTHLDEEVKTGEHTQAEADQKLTEFKANLDDMVNNVRPAGGPRGGHGPHGDLDGDGPMGAPQGAPGATQGSTGSNAQGASFNA